MTRLAAEGAMKLKLENRGQEVARVRNAGGNMIFCPRVEVLFGALDRGDNSLILLPQLPPGLVVFLWSNLSRKHLPAPLVDQKSKRQECDLVQGHPHQQNKIGAGRGH